jgi:KaiC/GvpD/RAD55 family RecA-like ATPase
MLGGGLEIHRSYLISGLTGIGKTEFFRAIQDKFYTDRPEDNIGILHFEEPVRETIQRAVGYKLKTPVHLEESHVSDETVLAEWATLSGREDRVHFVKHYGSEDPDVILAKIRFLVAACGCQLVCLDNITVLGTGRVQEDERKELDYLSTQLEMLVKELPFCLLFISHENENEGTRGSANINKVVDVWINLKRDVKAENEYARNILYLSLFKNRQASRTGPAGRGIYDLSTGVLTELTEELPT